MNTETEKGSREEKKTKSTTTEEEEDDKLGRSVCVCYPRTQVLEMVIFTFSFSPMCICTTHPLTHAMSNGLMSLADSSKNSKNDSRARYI